jgi:hypothetical protein
MAHAIISDVSNNIESTIFIQMQAGLYHHAARTIYTQANEAL